MQRHFADRAAVRWRAKLGAEASILRRLPDAAVLMDGVDVRAEGSAICPKWKGFSNIYIELLRFNMTE